MQLVGAGTFAQVYRDTEEDGGMAIKKTQLECAVWSLLPTHPNLLRLVKLATIKDRHHENQLFYHYYTRYFKQGDLYRLLTETGKLPFEATIYLLAGMARGLDAMHHNGFSHRDIKLENVLVTEDTMMPVLCDFDFSIKIDKQNGFCKYGRCGSIPYCAPEVLKNLEHDPRMADCWSLGVVLYAMSIGKLPFDSNRDDDNSEKRIATRILTNQYSLPPQHTLNPLIVNLITSLLDPNPGTRMTASQVVDTIDGLQVDTALAIEQINQLLRPVGHPVQPPPPPRIIHIHGNVSASMLVVFEDDIQGNEDANCADQQSVGYKPIPSDQAAIIR
jgi:protein-serine/threonine kinase